MNKVLATLVLVSLLMPSAAIATQIASERVAEDNRFRQERVRQAEAAVIKIKTKTKSGSGFIINHNGCLCILTNYHVIHNAKQIEIRSFYSGMHISDPDAVRIIATDPVRDIALLKINIDTSDKNTIPLQLDEKQSITDDRIYTIKKGSKSMVRNIQYLIVANSRNARNFETMGTIGGIEPAFYIGLRDNSLPSEYNYKLLLFESSITAGNSGAPVIDYENGKVIAIATGATGRKDYLAFSVPIKYAIDLIQKVTAAEEDNPKEYPVAKDYSWPDLNHNDKYYDNIKDLFAQQEGNIIYVTSTVTINDGTPLTNAWVSLNNGMSTYATYTANDGSYTLEIPRTDNTEWELTIQHRAITTFTKKITILPDGGNLLPESVTYKEKYRKPVLQFYIDPPVVDLKKRERVIKVVGKWRAATFTTKKPVKWKLCLTGNECFYPYDDTKKWVGISNRNNPNSYEGDMGNNLIISLKDKTIQKTRQADISFNAVNPENQERIRESVIRVYPYTITKLDYYYLQGFLQLTQGGWGIDNGISVKAYILGDDSNSRIPVNNPETESVDEFGYFKLEIPAEMLCNDKNGCNKTRKLMIEINTDMYQIASNVDGQNTLEYDYNLSKPRTLFIEMKPK